MAGSRLHAHNRHSCEIDELLQYFFLVVVFLALEACKSTHTNYITIGANHWYRLPQVFRLVAIHHHPQFCLQRPSILTDIENHCVHSQIHGCFLGT